MQFCKDLDTLSDISPTEMQKTFSEDEAQSSVNLLKNNKSTGEDADKAKLLNHGLGIFTEKIATIFN